MKFIWLAALMGAGVFASQESNVNSRYTVESVEVRGIPETKLSKRLRASLDAIVGQKLSQEKIGQLARRLRDEFPGRSVSERVVRGMQLDHVKVVFDVSRRKHEHFDLSVPGALYHSRQGWSGEIDAVVRAGTNSFTFGVVSNEDPLVERFAGLKAGYENRSLGTEWVGLAFLFESYHQRWDPATRSATDAVYRWRQNFQPQLNLHPARGLSLSAGTSFQRLQFQFPAARIEAANAAIVTLRYDRSLEDSASNVHRFEAGYGLRAATTLLDSDFVYARHTADFRYTLSRGRNLLKVHFLGGVIGGRAPLFERFSLGNSTTLRGWNKYDLAPAGGDRVVHNSVEYGWRALRIFYDTGAVWPGGEEADSKHSAGIGFRSGEFFLALAFPLRSGRAEPVLMTGLAF